jgi:O-antigen ligase
MHKIAGIILFFMMLFVPTAYTEIKILLIVLTLAGIFFSRNSYAPLNNQVLKWVACQIYTALFFITLGFINKNPGAIRVSSILIFWPILYTIFITGITKVEYVVALLRVIVIGGLAIGLYTLDFLMYSLNLIPSFLYLELDQGQIINFEGGSAAYNLYNISSLSFIIPFLVTLSIQKSDFSVKIFPKPVIIFTVVLDMICVMLSSRRAVLLVSVISIPMTLLLLNIAEKKGISKHKIKGSIFTALGVLLSLCVCLYILFNLLGLDSSYLLNLYDSAFNFENNESNALRKEQFEALMKGWSYSPIFGQGHGASAENYGSLRGGEEQPWAYELSYIAMLFHTGLVGLTIFLGSIFWLYFMLIKVMRSGRVPVSLIIPVISGMTCFLIANATNPYLGKYDALWILYLPLAMINIYLNHKS